jgi:hypothetical protein
VPAKRSHAVGGSSRRLSRSVSVRRYRGVSGA